MPKIKEFNPNELKVCTMCNEAKPIMMFFGVSGNKTYYARKVCTDCHKKKMKRVAAKVEARKLRAQQRYLKWEMEFAKNTRVGERLEKRFLKNLSRAKRQEMEFIHYHTKLMKRMTAVNRNRIQQIQKHLAEKSMHPAREKVARESLMKRLEVQERYETALNTIIEAYKNNQPIPNWADLV